LLLGRHDEAAELLAVYDQPETLFALSSYLRYANFDVRRYPTLLAQLEVQGIKPRPFQPEPYACKPEPGTP
jgi:hypothetical protein